MTINESTEMESDIEIDWSTSDLGIIMLMVAVTVVILHNFFFNIGWIQFIERSIIIVPVIIGLIVQPNYYFKKIAMKIVTAASPVVKRMALNNIVATSSVLTIISFTVKRTYSTSIGAIMFVVKKPFYISFSVFGCVLASINCVLLFNVFYYSRTIEAACLSLMILTASFNNVNFGRGLILVMSSFNIAFSIISAILIGASTYYENSILTFIGISSVTLLSCFVILRDIRSHEIVYIAVALSATVFTHDGLLSFVEIPNFVSQLLYYLEMEVLLVYFVTYQIYSLLNYVSIENLISHILVNLVYVFYAYILHAA